MFTKKQKYCSLLKFFVLQNSSDTEIAFFKWLALPHFFIKPHFTTKDDIYIVNLSLQFVMFYYIYFQIYWKDKFRNTFANNRRRLDFGFQNYRPTTRPVSETETTILSHITVRLLICCWKQMLCWSLLYPNTYTGIIINVTLQFVSLKKCCTLLIWLF